MICSANYPESPRSKHTIASRWNKSAQRKAEILEPSQL
ncbi:hypothetical protein VDGD_20793 [Verticillium dahliae]|nr:hypothetical protein VDGD_20793 [Verticillium dahliae]